MSSYGWAETRDRCSAGGVDSVTRQKYLQPSKLISGELTTESSTSWRVATPDEEMPGGWVAHNPACDGGDLIPTKSRLPIANQYEEISFALRM